jgi:ribA/ribD-fused uncharacterized protein
MNLEYKKISEAFKRDNKHWNLQLPELKAEFGEFELPGAFGFSYCKKINKNGLEFIDFKTAHRMSSDDYIRYDLNGEYSEPTGEIVRQSDESINQAEFETITRFKNISFNHQFNKLKNTDFETNEYEFFWSNDSPYSQWHKANFKLNNTEYSSAEQFMMAKKAELFGDEEIKKQILSTTNVRKQKELGRQVKNFDESKWNENKIKIVYIANNLKFNQNEELKAELLETQGKYIVEASPVDAIWGIGVAPEDPKRFNRAKWRGQNLLGKILTQLREDILTMKKYHT